MKFSCENYIAEMKDHLVGAMSFVIETDVEIGMDEPVLVKKVLTTETYSVHAVFVAGEIDGTVDFNVVCKEGTASISRITLAFSDVDAETICHCDTEQELLDSIKNAHQMYVTRKNTQGKRYKAINACCDQLFELSQTLNKKASEKLISIIKEIRNQVG